MLMALLKYTKLLSVKCHCFNIIEASSAVLGGLSMEPLRNIYFVELFHILAVFSACCFSPVLCDKGESCSVL